MGRIGKEIADPKKTKISISPPRIQCLQATGALLDAVVLLLLISDGVALDASYLLQLHSVQPLAKGC